MNRWYRWAPIAAALATAACSTSPRGEPKPSVPAGQTPGQYRVKLETSKGDVVVQVTREWAPLGADRFYALVKSGFFNNVRFFRVLPGFVVQFGLGADPGRNGEWTEIADDPPGQSNATGTITFATRGPNSRTSQVFINLGNNANLDGMGFTPFGRVVEGMPVVEQLNGEYGEGAPRGPGPDQSRIRSEGNSYLEREFPRLDYIKTASLME